MFAEQQPLNQVTIVASLQMQKQCLIIVQVEKSYSIAKTAEKTSVLLLHYGFCSVTVWWSCSKFLYSTMASTLVSGWKSSAGKRWWVFLSVDRLFPAEQREDEAVRRAELLNDGFVRLVWLQPSRVQASFVQCWPGHSYWKHPRLFVLLFSQTPPLFYCPVRPQPPTSTCLQIFIRGYAFIS